jgi:hypothetical protein
MLSLQFVYLLLPSQNDMSAEHWWLVPIILPTQEAEIRRIMVLSQPGQIVWETLPWKSPSQKRAGGVAQGIGPEFNPSTAKNKNKKVYHSVLLVKNPNSWLLSTTCALNFQGTAQSRSHLRVGVECLPSICKALGCTSTSQTPSIKQMVFLYEL